MSRFPAEINSKIVEQVNFDAECPETLKEDIRLFKVLNSIDQLKPIISRYMSIWIIYTPEIQFNYLKYSQTLRDLKNCTDSFFIITVDSPDFIAVDVLRSHYLTKMLEGHSPLIFDVNNFLGLETPQSALSLAIDQETFLEKLVLLSEKRPKRIIELILPHGYEEMALNAYCFGKRIIKRRWRDRNLLRFFDGFRLGPLKRLSGMFIDFNNEFNVFIDHKTIHWFPISDYDEYDFDEGFRKVQNFKSNIWGVCEFLTVATEFWGPTPVLDEIGFEKLNEIAVRDTYDNEEKRTIEKFREGVKYARKSLWTDHQEQLFHSEYYRVNRAPYYYLIETLSSKKWK